MAIQIQKVSHKKGRTSVRWLVTDESGRADEFSLASNDLPRPELVLALEDLREHVIEICELGSGLELERVEVTGASYSDAQDIMGACITCLVSLETSQAPLCLTTPHKPSVPYSEGDPGAEEYCLTSEAIAALDRLAREARLYVGGNRAQMRVAEAA